MKIPVEVAAALAGAATDGPRLVLTGPRMTPTFYRRVNDVLEAIGGRWDTREQAHVFPADAAVAVAEALAGGEVVTAREKRQSAQFFPTPAGVVARLVELARIEPGMVVLEPSAGAGAIASALLAAEAAVECVERDHGFAADLARLGMPVRTGDFLGVPPEPRFDRVVMNPPFTRGTDMLHVQHALRFLKPDGLLVAVMSWTVTEHTRASAGFRNLVAARGGTCEALAAKAFAKSGTDVPTVIVTIPATRPDSPPPLVWPEREVPQRHEEELRSPAEILDDIRANLREATRIFDELADMLATPIDTARLAERGVQDAVRQEQLSFDAMESAS